MGILTLDEETDFYAVVGGDGTDGSTSKVGNGGYNGGGYGGFSYSTSYCCGSGGGGATDIRLNVPEDFEPEEPIPTPGIPRWFKEYEYISNSTTKQGYFNTGYIAKENTVIEVKVSTTGALYDGFVFGARHSTADREFCLTMDEGPNSDVPAMPSYIHGQYMSYGWSAGTSANPPTIFSVDHLSDAHVYRMSKDGVWVDGERRQTIPFQTYNAPTLPIFLFGCNNNGSFGKQFQGNLYYCKIWEGDTLVHHYVPGINMPGGVVCLYDVCTNNLLHPSDSSKFTVVSPIEDTRIHKSLLTRIMVAGGGGGGTTMQNVTDIDNSFNCAVGGGIVGGAIQVNKSLAGNGKYASQTSGYSFGIGQTPAKSIIVGNGDAEGHGGGGGGWYGGWACTTYTGGYTSGNGGGGSGYVLTESSHKPEGYEVPEKFYMRDWYMKAGAAETPCVIISQLTADVVAGDVIVYYPVGKGCRTSLPAGTYIFKCWGADGGVRYSRSSDGAYECGGYSQGTYVTPNGFNAYIHVGGSGMNDSQISSEFVHQLCPDLRYNGGGAPAEYGIKMTGHSGGGATDIRINFDSLYARVIVAGGAGGCSYDGYEAGNGGGEVGGSPKSGGGACPGPGTQTSSPISLDYPAINGGFGYGGNAGYRSASYIGGAGGGGWYGGSGTMPTQNSNNARGGAGGSGFVLTSASIENVPQDYLLDETHCLSEATTTVGGNRLPAGFSKAEIEVVKSYQQKVLCRDSDGIKYLDQNDQTWKLLEIQDLTIATFTAYGVGIITSDTGLQEEFEILTWDPTDSVTHIDINVIPNKQTVQQITVSSLPVKKTYFDLDYDRTKFDVDLKVVRHQAGPNTELITNVTIDKLVPTNEDTKIYYARYLTK